MYSKMNGYPSSSFRSSSGRLWGMSHSLPSGMSNYLQDADFSSYSRPRLYGDMPSSSTFGGGNPSTPHHHHHHHHHNHSQPASHHHTSSSSTSSLTGMNFGPGGSSSSSGGGNAGTNLIVNYLPQDMTEREMYSMFSSIGPLESCRLMRDLKQTGYSYGFGFVNYLNEDSAQRAIKCLNGYPLRNKRLKVSYARPQSDDIKETNLYITNLPRTITEEQLDIIFGKYGTIVQKNILRDKLTGQPRGVAFVRFNKREEAQEAISALNNVIPQGGNQPLIVRVAEDHGRAKAALYVPSYNSIVHNNRGRVRMRNTPY